MQRITTKHTLGLSHTAIRLRCKLGFVFRGPSLILKLTSVLPYY